MTQRVRATGLRFVALSMSALLGAAAPAMANDAQLALGKSLFQKGAVPVACSVCHTLKDAGAEGAVGPSLDELKPDATRVANAMRNGVGAMPSFKATLTDAQIQAVAAYVAAASRK
jgi:sulfite dehydrogenase